MKCNKNHSSPKSMNITCEVTFVRGVTEIQCNVSLEGRNPLIMTIDMKAPSVASERCRVTVLLIVG